jgi:hypothetical protein
MTLATKRLPSPAASSVDLIGPAEITTSCYHAEGWDNISAIDFKLADATNTIFVGRYVKAENKVYVEDPANPGTFLPPGTPGSGSPIETANVILDVPHMPQPSVAISTSSVLDIKWILYFKPPTFNKDYVQSINIRYNSPPGTSSGAAGELRTPQQVIIETGFFRVGALSVGQRVMLPVIRR